MTMTGKLLSADGLGRTTELAKNVFTWWDPYFGITGVPYAADGRVIAIVSSGTAGSYGTGVWLLDVK